MNYLNVLSIVVNVILSIIMIVLLVPTIKLIVKDKTRFIAVFFAMALMSSLLSDLYWIAYDALRPGTRMPFAADEIADGAMILLLSACLETLLHDKKKMVPGEIIFTLLYIGANMALWIVWSGEWVQDIVFGLPYVYFLWLLIRGLRSSKAMKKIELFIVSSAGVIVVAIQTIALFADEHGAFMLDLVSYALMFVVIAWLGFLCFRRKNTFIVFAFFLWTILATFATSELFYCIATSALGVSYPLMYLAVRKEAVK